MCLVITFIGFLIHVFAAGYMADEPGLRALLRLPEPVLRAMLVLVLGDSLPVMFIGWEGVGLCSYLLIGFWYSSTANADAARRRSSPTGSATRLPARDVPAVPVRRARCRSRTSTPPRRGGPLRQTLWLGPAVAFWAALFLFVGRDGQVGADPLYVWLPDAMAGPTPVSALIHAATMVTAGVYMVARMHLSTRWRRGDGDRGARGRG
jgi:NADH-quinone oxidoreductase subunit L